MNSKDKLKEILESEIDRYHALQKQRPLSTQEVSALEKLVNTFTKLQDSDMSDNELDVIGQMSSEDLKEFMR